MLGLRIYIFLYSAALGVFGVVGTFFLLANGHRFADIGLYAIALSFSVVLAEIPTGIIADKYAPRISLALSSLLRMLVALLYLVFYTNFEGILIASILAGLSEAFFSGAYQKEAMGIGHRMKLPTQQIFANLTFIRLAGTLAGGVIGYLVWQYALFSIWYIPLILFCVSQLYFFRNSQTKSQSRPPIQESPPLQAKLTKERLLIFVKSGYFWLLVLNSVAAIAPILGSQYILEKLSYGLLIGFLGYNFAGMLGAKLAEFQKYTRYFLPLTLLANAAIVISLGLFELLGYWFIPLAIMHVLLHTYQTVVATSLFQNSIDEPQRATLTSIASVSDAILAIPIYLSVGLLMDSNMFLFAMSVSGLTILLIFAILMWNYQDYRDRL